MVPWQWVLCTLMSSPVTRTESTRAPLGCARTGDLQHEYYAIISTWSKISEKCFQHLVESRPRTTEVDLRDQRTKGVLPSISMVFLIELPMSEHSKHKCKRSWKEESATTGYTVNRANHKAGCSSGLWYYVCYTVWHATVQAIAQWQWLDYRAALHDDSLTAFFPSTRT